MAYTYNLLPNEKIYSVTGVCFSPLIAGETHQQWVPPICEREEGYTHNGVYFLLPNTRTQNLLFLTNSLKLVQKKKKNP